jgi:hypothetical protein
MLELIIIFFSDVFANPICPIITLLACPRITRYTVTIENTRERKNPKEPFDLSDHSLELVNNMVIISKYMLVRKDENEDFFMW